jgi:Glycosyltransferase family 28 N-terminal domain.
LKKPYHILLSGGGTGGHIYPAIAIANELKARHANASILFVGAKDKNGKWKKYRRLVIKLKAYGFLVY